MDGKTLVEGPADDIFFIDAKPGRHTVAVMDTIGHSDSLVIAIQQEPIKSIITDK